MINIDREYVTAAFLEYTDRFDSSDNKIILKREHTFRVADNCDYIARELGLDKDDVNLAWLLGMLHDIGRFEQVKRYGTFVDAKSVDHAKLGSQLLFKEGLMELFLPGSEETLLKGDTFNDLSVINVAISNHNTFKIEEGLRQREEMFCKIIRDADKIDIFKVIYETPLQQIYGYDEEYIKKAAITDEVKEQFLERHTILRAIKKTPADNYISFIAFAFELEFECSRELTKEQGYLKKMFDFKWENEDTAKFFELAKEMIKP
ncbi:MAG: HD domain-containing protein [Lachnospiraceae bacterium]|nr:HD domain-containing protein [Lachnospiraceae bacterium]